MILIENAGFIIDIIPSGWIPSKAIIWRKT
jgi:hypothetical protein